MTMWIEGCGRRHLIGDPSEKCIHSSTCRPTKNSHLKYSRKQRLHCRFNFHRTLGEGGETRGQRRARRAQSARVTPNTQSKNSVGKRKWEINSFCSLLFDVLLVCSWDDRFRSIFLIPTCDIIQYHIIPHILYQPYQPYHTYHTYHPHIPPNWLSDYSPASVNFSICDTFVL